VAVLWVGRASFQLSTLPQHPVDVPHISRPPENTAAPNHDIQLGRSASQTTNHARTSSGEPHDNTLVLLLNRQRLCVTDTAATKTRTQSPTPGASITRSPQRLFPRTSLNSDIALHIEGQSSVSTGLEEKPARLMIPLGGRPSTALPTQVLPLALADCSPTTTGSAVGCLAVSQPASWPRRHRPGLTAGAELSGSGPIAAATGQLQGPPRLRASPAGLQAPTTPEVGVLERIGLATSSLPFLDVHLDSTVCPTLALTAPRHGHSEDLDSLFVFSHRTSHFAKECFCRTNCHPPSFLGSA
jgi:hypothetical protein